jgi:SAM-dependent methyltransferase
MRKDPRLDQIPKGNTCRGVHRAIIEYLLESGDVADGKTMLDIPCGAGFLISSLRLFFPKAVLRGCDMRMPKTLSPGDFSPVDASRPFTVFPGMKFDFVFSVSGVMEFDNTLQFFAQCKDCLRDGGLFLVTNDNVVAIRDRIAYFWLGKVRRYQLFVTQGQPTWKVIPVHNMVRILQDAEFKIREIRYTSLRWKDWLMLPLALLVYPIQFLYMRFTRTKMPIAMRHEMYPFRSLLCRHYIIVCEKLAA